ncbi:hypothetical protein [Ruegeria sp. HKCCA5763]|uniref:hypothetical protein n=1 Tax=Ruegeria sp. HKCCA5763 TaxID=2682987 RepID=UPI001488E95F|nr:hypothetical protein [Ruegeria sp. HKCCA5763]
MRSTFIRGLLLLLPMAVAVIVLAKLFQFGRSIAEPVADRFLAPGPYAWIFVDLGSTIVLILICLLLGKLAGKGRETQRFNVFDNLLADYFPRYTVLKSFMQGGNSGSQEVGLPDPVVYRTDDGARIAFEIERTGDLVTVYVPDAPNIWSGEVVFAAKERILQLDMSAVEAATFMRQLGRGAQARLPEEL